MSKKVSYGWAFLLLVVLLVACGGTPETGADEVPVVDAVVSTPTTDPAQPVTSTEGDTGGDTGGSDTTGVGGGAAGQNGTITGGLIYPSEGIPPMRIVAVTTNGGAFYSAETGPNDGSYTINLPPGQYYVYAYPQGLNTGAAHSTATWCYAEPTVPGETFESDCDRHDEVAVTVVAGQTKVGVDIYDWYAGPDAFPPPPDAPVASGGQTGGSTGGATGGSTGSNTGGPTGGNTSGPPSTVAVIGGRLSYPSEGIPPLSIYALRTDGQSWQFIYTVQNQTSYAMQLAPGTYHILAEVQIDGLIGKFSGAYTAYAACLALDPQCASNDHTLVPVTVKAGDALDNIDITDWYAGEGVFPAVPN